MRRIKVVYLIATMQYGGQEQYLAQQITKMDRTKFEPILCCLKAPGPLVDRVTATGIEVFSGFQHFKYDLSTLIRFAKFLRRQKPDILYLFDLRSVLFIGRLAGKLSRVPLCIAASHRSNHFRSGRSYGWLDRALIPLTDHFIAAAKSHRDSLIKKDGLNELRVTAIYNGVDLQRLQNDLSFQVTRNDLQIPERAKIVGSVVRLSREKSIDVLMQAVVLMADTIPDIRLILVGDGPEHERLVQRAEELHITGRVHFLGFRRRVAPIVRLFDVFALASTATETFSAATLEAMALGIPAVVTDVGSMAEMVVDGITGYLVPPYDPESLAAKIALLLANPQMAERFGAAARQRVMQSFTAEREIKQIETLFEQLLSQKRAI